MRFLFSIVFVLFVLASCQTKPIKTIVPPPIVETQPSWDGENQNSGLIEYVKGEGFLITPKAAQRYIALTQKFGNTLTPTVQAGEGLVKKGDNFLLSPEYMSVFMVVSRLNKQ
jgi:hypothetical protein